MSEYEIAENSTVQIIDRNKNLVDIGVFDSLHLESKGWEWLMQTKNVASKEEVNEIVEELGASQTAQVQIITPVKGLKCE